jgi:hypothetical protein
MTSDTSPQPISPLRARMIEDRTRLQGGHAPRLCATGASIRAFATFIGRSPDTATAEELRLFQMLEWILSVEEEHADDMHNLLVAHEGRSMLRK